MKVLHIISSGGMYGAEAVILNLSRTLNEQGHSSALAVFSNSSNPNLQLHQAALQANLESHVLPCRGQVDTTLLAAIRAIVAETHADIVHAHGYKADIYTHLALRRTAIPYISTCHNWLRQNWMVSLYGIADRLALRKFVRVIAVSDEVKQRLLQAGVREDKIHIVRNGIDLRPFAAATPSLQRNPEDLLIGWIGRLSHEKGADVLLRAAPHVLANSPSARFVVVGEGPDREKMEQLIDNLGIRSQVTMAGRRDDMPAVYASLDLMVSSSRQEGLPMAILEGMASGLPLIATAVGDVPTIVRDGITGLLVESEDVEGMTNTILDLLRNPAKRLRLGTAARQLIQEEYSAEQMADEHLKIYEDAFKMNQRAQAK